MSTTTRIKDHQQHMCLEELDKSATAELSTDREHHAILQDTDILSTKSKHTIPIFMGAAKTELQPSNKNRENGCVMSGSWKPLMHHMNEQTKTSCGDTLLYHPPSFSLSLVSSLSLLVPSFAPSSHFFIVTLLSVASSTDSSTHITTPLLLLTHYSNHSFPTKCNYFFHALTLLGLYFTCKHQASLKHM
jgi:hypothetical protein